MTDETTRTYEVVTKDGAFRIDVPAGSRITFGPVVSVAGKPSYGDGGMSLRIWEGKELQRALFLNVLSFRDCSMPMKVRAVRMFGADDWVKDDGQWTGKKADLVEKGWVDSDLITEQVIVEVPAENSARWDLSSGWALSSGSKPSAAALRTRAVLAGKTKEDDEEIPF